MEEPEEEGVCEGEVVIDPGLGLRVAGWYLPLLPYPTYSTILSIFF